MVEFQKFQEEIRRIVDLPDLLLRMFVRIAVHNGGRISNAKRSKFDKLTDAESRPWKKSCNGTYQSCPLLPTGRKWRIR